MIWLSIFLQFLINTHIKKNCKMLWNYETYLYDLYIAIV
jgi:hypothetical protein